MKNAVLFDLDGTLIDSAPLHTDAFSRAVRVWWKDCEVPTRTDLTTQQKMDMLEVPAELRENIQKTARMTTMDLIPIMVKPDKRMIGEIEDLSRDFLIGVVTNARRAPAEAMLHAMGIWPRIDALITSEDGKHKPAPDLYFAAKNRLAKARWVMAVEDSDSGEQAAKGAHIPCLRVCGPQDITAHRIRDFRGHN